MIHSASAENLPIFFNEYAADEFFPQFVLRTKIFCFRTCPKDEKGKGSKNKD